MPLREVLLGTVVAAIMCACARHRAPPVPPPTAAMVRVVNGTGSGASMWVADANAHWRLGEVPARATGDFVIPPRFLARDSVRFLAFRSGSPCVHQTWFPVEPARGFLIALQPGMRVDSLVEQGKELPKRRAPCRWD